MDHKNSEYMTVKEVADLLRIHPNTVRKWSKNGLLPNFRLPGGRGDRRFPRSSLERMVRL